MFVLRAASAKRVAAVVAVGVGLALLVGNGRAQTPPTSSTKPDAGLLSLPDDKPIRGMTYPSLSPDGKMLCFTYLGDLWTVPSSGGVATRQTVHEAVDTFSHWSPDGKWIAFTSARTGNYDIFLVPARGGSARQVTFNSSSDVLCDWSPDGQKLLFYSRRDTPDFALFSIDLRTRAIKKLSQDDTDLRFGTWSPDGSSIAYVRAGQPWWRPWYHGSVAASVVVRDTTTGKVRTLLKSSAQEFWPHYSPDGKSIYLTTIYGSGSNTPNLWRVPVNGGEPKAITHYATDAVRFPDMARDGSLITYVWNGDIYTVKPDGGEPKKVNIIAESDDKINNQERQTVNQGVTGSELSPDGKQLALVIKGDLWLVPVGGGDAKRLTDDPANDNDIAWSPDGKKLVFVSDRGNQPDLYTIDVASKALTRLTSDADAKSNTEWSPDGKYISYARAGAEAGLYVVPAGGGAARRLAEGNGNNNFGIGITAHGWSPDSRWVAFSRMDRFGNNDVWVVPAVGGAATNVTRYPGDNVSPKFTKDGRHLLFTSDRNGPQQLFQIPLEQEEDTSSDSSDDDKKKKVRPDRSKDVRIDFDDIHLRAKLVTSIFANVFDYEATPDSQKVVVQLGGAFGVAPINGGSVQPLAGDFGLNIEFVPDGSRFYYIGPNGTPRSLAVGGGPPSTLNFSAALVFDRRVQYQQAFNEFYRRFGAAFYDAKMHGVDWKGLRARYEPLLQAVATPQEFSDLLSMMVGAVNSSHSEISPATAGPPGPQTATLGIYYDDSYTGPGLKVSGVMLKGPADKPSSRVVAGEYVMSVDGTDVKMNEDYYQTLQDKAGKTVELLVNSKPTKDGAHTVKVKPISYTDWTNLEYEARVRRNRELVDKLSDNRLAYIHIREMDPTSTRRFERELWSDAAAKEGLVLDIRGNGGGNTHDTILEDLARHVYAFQQPRDGFRQTQPERAWTKPVVLLIDQNSYSDAEIFPAGFRSLHLGKIVGVPTPGYVIGTFEGQLVDGTRFRMPTWAFYTTEGKNLENLGISPDVVVENTPEDTAAGRDRQLETAVQTLLHDLPSHSDNTVQNQTGTDVFSSANANPNGGSSAVRPHSQK